MHEAQNHPAKVNIIWSIVGGPWSTGLVHVWSAFGPWFLAWTKIAATPRKTRGKTLGPHGPKSWTKTARFLIWSTPHTP